MLLPRMLLLRAALLCLAFSAARVQAMDPSFELLRETDSVRIYSKKQPHCLTQGVNVLFVVENKIDAPLEVELRTSQTLPMNTLRVRLDPMGKTSVISLAPVETCDLRLVDVKLREPGA